MEGTSYPFEDGKVVDALSALMTGEESATLLLGLESTSQSEDTVMRRSKGGEETFGGVVWEKGRDCGGPHP